MNLFQEPLQVPRRFGLAQVSARPLSRLLTKPTGSIARYDFSLNPYVGCGFDCSYCYAANFVPDDDRRLAWGQWIEVKTSAVEEFEWSDKWQGKRLFMSSATDPYQPLESKVGLTRKLVELMASAREQPTLVVQTRGPLVTRDIDLLKQLKRVRVNLSITTDSDRIRRIFEPRCASIERRLDAVRQLKAAGITVGISVCPLLPMEDPSAFGRLLAKIGPDVVYANTFHRSDRRFAADTRPQAWGLLDNFAWRKRDFEDAAEAIRRELPDIYDADLTLMSA